jgi:hypothetical protein
MGKQQDYKRLRRIAKKLPPDTKQVDRIKRVDGNELRVLIENTPGAKLPEGGLSSKSYYRVRVTETQRVDHYAELKKAWDAGGLDAVRKYVEPYMETAGEAGMV